MQAILLLMAASVVANTDAQSGYRWQGWPDWTEQVALVDAKGKQLGIWLAKEEKYYPLLSPGKWGAPVAPPIYPPVEANFGVDKDKIGKTPGYTRYGKPCSKKEALSAIGDGVPDDRRKLRLTVIGPKEQQSKVLQDLKSHPALLPWKDQLVVQAYTPDHWAVKDVGFVTGGSPTIYLQQPDGKVLHRQDRYDGAEELASAIRKADPNYQPDRDKQPIKPVVLPGGFDLAKVPGPVWALGGVSLLLLLSRRSQ